MTPSSLDHQFHYEVFSGPTHLLRRSLNMDVFKRGFDITEEERIRLRKLINDELKKRGIESTLSINPKFLTVVLALNPAFNQKYGACPKPAWARQALLWLCRNIVEQNQRNKSKTRRRQRVRQRAEQLLGNAEHGRSWQHQQQELAVTPDDMISDVDEELHQRIAGTWQGRPSNPPQPHSFPAPLVPPTPPAPPVMHRQTIAAQRAPTAPSRPARLQLPRLDPTLTVSSSSSSESEPRAGGRRAHARRCETDSVLDEEDVRLELRSIKVKQQKLDLEARRIELERKLRRMQRKRKQRCLSE